MKAAALLLFLGATAAGTAGALDRNADDFEVRCAALARFMAAHPAGWGDSAKLATAAGLIFKFDVTHALMGSARLSEADADAQAEALIVAALADYTARARSTVSAHAAQPPFLADARTCGLTQ